MSPTPPFKLLLAEIVSQSNETIHVSVVFKDAVGRYWTKTFSQYVCLMEGMNPSLLEEK